MPSHYGNSDKKSMSMDERLKEHAKQHKGGMRSKHMMNMKKFIKAGDSFEKAHKKAMAADKEGKEGVFSETKDKIKHGALRKALKVKDDEVLKRPELMKALKTKTGEMFKYNNNSFKMTETMRKRIQLAVNMMKK